MPRNDSVYLYEVRIELQKYDIASKWSEAIEMGVSDRGGTQLIEVPPKTQRQNNGGLNKKPKRLDMKS